MHKINFDVLWKSFEEYNSMFGSWTQIQFSVFESNFLWVPPSFFSFGNCIMFLNPNPITVQMILKSTFFRTANSYFHFSFSVLIFNFLFIQRSALFLLDSRWTIADEATKSTNADEEATCSGAVRCGEAMTMEARRCELSGNDKGEAMRW